MKMPSTMGHKFSEVPKAEIQRSQFDRSFGYKTTFDAGHLIPFYVDEALPGDTFQLNTQGFARLATPLKPIMDNMYMDTFFFAIPYRLVWTNFQRFMGEVDDPADVGTDYLIPTMSEANVAVGTLADYMGIPVEQAAGIRWSSLHFRAYNLVWNEFFRDQNIQDSLVVDKDDGPDTYGDYVLKRRGKRHDYFTSCLPWPQKGDAVSLPLSGNAVIHAPDATNVAVYGDVAAGYRALEADVGASDLVFVSSSVGVAADALYADLSSVTAATINELRQAFQLQKLLERDARGGTRYTEKIKAHFGVTSPDARLQRPEYLGGGSSNVTVSPIAQTSVAGATPQGNLAAIGTTSFGGHGFVKSFTEHTLLLGLVSVRADLTYSQGLERFWSRQTQYDLFWPALAFLGEQEVLRQELYCTGEDLDDPIIFGYTERYAEYRYKPSKITGLFRPGVTGSLAIWHLSQDFGGGNAWDPLAPPTLSNAFIQENPPVDRVIAVTTEPHFIFDSYTTLKCARPMPLYGVPGLIDHF